MALRGSFNPELAEVWGAEDGRENSRTNNEVQRGFFCKFQGER